VNPVRGIQRGMGAPDLFQQWYCGNSFEVGFPTLWHSITLGFQLGQGN
jgi:hypothetical protein